MKLAHTRLLVADVKASLAFYRDVIGLKPRFGSESVYEEFECNGHVLAIFDRKLMDSVTNPNQPQGRSDSAAHVVICFQVDSVDEALCRLEALGGHAVTQPHDQPQWMVRVAHLRDPDGNLLEINAALK